MPVTIHLTPLDTRKSPTFIRPHFPFSNQILDPASKHARDFHKRLNARRTPVLPSAHVFLQTADLLSELPLRHACRKPLPCNR